MVPGTVYSALILAGLSGEDRLVVIEPSPTGRRVGPDRTGRTSKLAIVEGSKTYDHIVGLGRAVGEQRRATLRAETTSDEITSIRWRYEFCNVSAHPQRALMKEYAVRGISRAQVLAGAAPAGSRSHWIFEEREFNRAAQAPAIVFRHASLSVAQSDQGRSFPQQGVSLTIRWRMDKAQAWYYTVAYVACME
jgi:hypothetical protein